MTEARDGELRTLLTQAGLEWLAGDPGNVSGLLRALDQAAAEYDGRFHTRVDLLAACKAMPEKMRAFLQALAAGVTPPLLSMVARMLLRDAWVSAVRFEFAARRSAALHIEIEDPDLGAQSFDSTDIWDAEVLRHFGLMKVGDAPIIDGYYAARTP